MACGPQRNETTQYKYIGWWISEDTFHCIKAVSQLNVYHFSQQNENNDDNDKNNDNNENNGI